jgi:hypothetical protein
MNTDRIFRIEGDLGYVEYSDGTKLLIGNTSVGQASDTYHTLNELYRHRALLTAALFGAWTGFDIEPWEPGMGVHKARLHSDGTKLDGFFIVMAQLPTGQISYHYPDADWGLFSIPEQDRAAVWDGHTAADVVTRLQAFLSA